MNTAAYKRRLMTTFESLRVTMPSVRELTVRAVVLGGLITVAFTAANVYLGLKVGLTSTNT